MSRATISNELEDPNAFIHSLSTTEPNEARRKTFEAITRLEYPELDAICLRGAKVPEQLSARIILNNVSALSGLRSREAAALLGVSEARISRNDSVNILMLDRAEGLADAFARVSAVLSPEGARYWLREPNAALDGAAPYTLLSTQYGHKKLDNLLEALLNGAVV